MPIIIYGGTERQILEQLDCAHANMTGPCLDGISRYYKCADCLCIERDCKDEDEYYRLWREDQMNKGEDV